MTTREAIAYGEGVLESARCESPRLDAELLLEHATGRTRTELYAEPERVLPTEEESRLREYLARRARREPAAYIIGEWGFRGLTLTVNPYVLVPRPETEIVVDRALAGLATHQAPRVLDVGTGSGAIALAIAAEHPGADVVATDISAAALAVAAGNRARLGLDQRVELALGHLDARVPGPFDLIISNPPYVTPDEFERLDPEIRLYEPREAVVGVGVHSAVARRAMELLVPAGLLVIECGETQHDAIARELGEAGFIDIATSHDLNGRPRVVEARHG